MIRLSGIKLREIALPLKEPFRTAQSVTTIRRALLLELSDADGVSTWSECVAEARRGYSDETVDTCWTQLAEYIGPAMLDQDFPSPQAADAILAMDYPDNRMARAAVEMGMWNLAAIKAGTALAKLLCGDRGAPNLAIPAGIAIGMHDSPEQLAERCRAAVAEGYQRIKIKITPGSDVEFVRAARDAVPAGIALSVDGNRSYSLTDDDCVTLRSLDDAMLAMIEQPLRYHSENARLQRSIATPICLDESICGLSDVHEMLQLDSGRMVNLKPGRVGGFTESLAIHDACVAHDVPLWCGGMNETGIGRAYNVALASLPGFTMPGDLSPSSRYWTQDIVVPEWKMDSGGLMRVPLERPGLGVDIDTALIDRLTVRESVIRRL